MSPCIQPATCDRAEQLQHGVTFSNNLIAPHNAALQPLPLNYKGGSRTCMDPMAEEAHLSCSWCRHLHLQHCRLNIPTSEVLLNAQSDSKKQSPALVQGILTLYKSARDLNQDGSAARAPSRALKLQVSSVMQCCMHQGLSALDRLGGTCLASKGARCTTREEKQAWPVGCPVLEPEGTGNQIALLSPACAVQKECWSCPGGCCGGVPAAAA